MKVCVLLVFVAVALSAPLRDQPVCSDANECICNQQCGFCNSRVWTFPKYFLLESDPLYSKNVNHWAWDGDSDFFDVSNNCNLENVCENFISTTSAVPNPTCQAALWVYTYHNQARLSPRGKFEYYDFINFAYQPSVDAWKDFCNGDTNIPEYEDNDPSTTGVKEADYTYWASYADYDNFYCTLTETASPILTEAACTPHRHMDLPSTYFCNGFNTLYGGNCAVPFAFDTESCNVASGSCSNLDLSSPLESTGLNGGYPCTENLARLSQAIPNGTPTAGFNRDMNAREMSRGVVYDMSSNCAYTDNIGWQY
jgi:hypothetical protein